MEKVNSAIVANRMRSVQERFSNPSQLSIRAWDEGGSCVPVGEISGFIAQRRAADLSVLDDLAKAVEMGSDLVEVVVVDGNNFMVTRRRENSGDIETTVAFQGDDRLGTEEKEHLDHEILVVETPVDGGSIDIEYSMPKSG